MSWASGYTINTRPRSVWDRKKVTEESKPPKSNQMVPSDSDKQSSIWVNNNSLHTIDSSKHSSTSMNSSGGSNGGGGGGMMMGFSKSSPFTVSQWQELEHQALIFKYMVAGLPVPPDLVLPFHSHNFFHHSIPTRNLCFFSSSQFLIHFLQFP